MCGVALCWAGNALTVLNGTPDRAGSAEYLWGDALCITAAALYALYTVLIRALAPADLPLFFGLLGLLNFALFAPVVAVLHATGAEDLSPLFQPGGGHIFGVLVAKARPLQAASIRPPRAHPDPAPRAHPTPTPRPRPPAPTPRPRRASQTTCCRTLSGPRQCCSPRPPPRQSASLSLCRSR